ncbi:tissue inhibitor of metalloproteinase [Anoplophora glabripennis]|uniref:tissue inhibitor of metalloproteinase n=1 Tax=Anoplophora glabripennis TaxID=217634 RepID=UPI0008742BE5|nr:tissue inhibitor of metalloproteinase [Anoplophora glabripennis]XP_018563422.1 tissue inhibitor of metalloproteinase [Anoplophora glabripennis]
MKADAIVLTLVFLCGVLVYTEACTCMPTHPQEHYCNSNFVILARVKRERIHNQTRFYKVRVRKQYKITEKGEVALKSGRIITPLYDSMCGVELQPGKLYVLSGRIHSLKAHVSLCDMAVEWEKLTRRQRKGLKLLYKHGCTCKINQCRFGRKCYRQRDGCNWSNDCETKEGICLRQANKSCMWTRNKALATCNASQKYKTLLYNLP